MCVWERESERESKRGEEMEVCIMIVCVEGVLRLGLRGKPELNPSAAEVLIQRCPRGKRPKLKHL